MKDIISTIYGNTKLTRSILAVGCLTFAGAAMLQGIAVPTWFQTLATTAVLSYFVTRGNGG